LKGKLEVGPAIAFLGPPFNGTANPA